MDGWAELYYRTDADQEADNKVLPYAVNCEEHKKINFLVNRLKDAGFTLVPTSTGTPSLMTSFLVNIEFKKYYKIPYPVHFSCVGDKVYSIEEFIKEVLTAII